MLRSCRDCFDIQTEKDVEEFKAQSQPLQALRLQNAINLANSPHKKHQQPRTFEAGRCTVGGLGAGVGRDGG